MNTSSYETMMSEDRSHLRRQRAKELQQTIDGLEVWLGGGHLFDESGTEEERVLGSPVAYMRKHLLWEARSD